GNNSLLPYFAQTQLDTPHDYVVYVLGITRSGQGEPKHKSNPATDMHAGESETSMSMIARPDLVHLDRAPQESGADQARLKLPEGLAHRGPVHVAIAEVHPGVAVLRALEIFEVDLDDGFAQGANPVLGIAVQHDIADIEPGPDPRAVKFADVLGHFERTEQEPVPDFLDRDDDLELLRQREEVADLRLRARPGIAIGGLRIHHRRDEQYRIGAPEFRVLQ